MTTLAVLRNGLFSTFTACGPYSATQISTCDYGVIERSTGCALFFKPEEGSFEPITFGNTGNVSTKYGTIIFEGECYIQFTGDVPVFLGQSEEHTSELQSQSNVVCRLLLEKKN